MLAGVGCGEFVCFALGFVVCDLFTNFALSSEKPGKGRALSLFNALATLWNYALTSIVKRIFQILIISLTDIIRKICRGFSYSLLPVSDSWSLPIVESFLSVLRGGVVVCISYKVPGTIWPEYAVVNRLERYRANLVVVVVCHDGKSCVFTRSFITLH